MSKYTESIEVNCKGLTCINSSPASVCVECLSRYEIEETGDIDTMQDELYEKAVDPWFSWSKCDTCGSKLGGNRYDAHGFDANGAVIHLDICEDCLVYFANGDEPDNWN